MRLFASLCLATLLVLRLVHPAAASDATSSSARYAVSITLNWTQENNPAEFPFGAHWSRLLAVAHTGRYALFNDGDTASSGLALIATNGRTSVLEAELDEVQRRRRASEPIIVRGIAGGAGTFSLQIDVSQRLSRVSFATMLAPSPDWFAGVSGAELADADGNWRETVSLPVWVWDAGADSGVTFRSDNAPTQPRQSVRLLTHPAFLQADGLRPIGTVTFRRLHPEAAAPAE